MPLAGDSKVKVLGVVLAAVLTAAASLLPSSDIVSFSPSVRPQCPGLGTVTELPLGSILFRADRRFSLDGDLTAGLAVAVMEGLLLVLVLLESLTMFSSLEDHMIV